MERHAATIEQGARAQSRGGSREPSRTAAHAASHAGSRALTIASPARILQRMAGNDATIERRGESGVNDEMERRLDARRGGGMPLTEGTRWRMESGIGADFGGVRVHADADAASISRSLGARAFTLGREIYFGAGEYRPETREGSRLLAHELTHVVQQGAAPSAAAARAGGSGGRAPAGTIQRQPSDASPPITAQTIIPFPVGSKVRMDRIMNEVFFEQMKKEDPTGATGFNALDQQTATIGAAGPDEVSGTVPNPVAVPAVKDQKERTLTEVTLRLRRKKEGENMLFDLDLLWKEPDAKAAEVMFFRHDMTAKGEGGSVILSQKGAPILRSTTASDGSSMTMEAYTAPFMDKIPEEFRFLVPKKVDLLSARKLPDAPQGPPDAKGSVEQVATALPKRAPIPFRMQTMVGGGVQNGVQWNPIITSSWQISFKPIPMLDNIVQIPIEVQLQYAPPESVLATASSGLDVSLAQLQIPVNFRVIRLGAGGGVVPGGEPPGGGPQLPAAGITLGTGAGLEIGHFRLDLRYDHLFNLFSATPGAPRPDVNALSAGVGAVW